MSVLQICLLIFGTCCLVLALVIAILHYSSALAPDEDTKVGGTD